MRTDSVSAILAVLFLLVGLATERPATARVVLKPVGQRGQPLRPRSLNAEVEIEGAFASSLVTLVFHNPAAGRVEADFIYMLPPDTLATEFAYWFGDEKVVARVMEKERAAEIYRNITSRRRDPALIEMVGKQTFRARIFPVEANADLKVEMRLVQVLPSDGQGPLLRFPLRLDESALESLQVNVRIRKAPDLRGVTTNLGLPIQEAAEGYSLSLRGRNYRPPAELLVRLRRPKRPLHAELYAAPSGGGDGFFALALSPDREVRRPNLSVEGVQVHSLAPALPARMAAHATTTLYGRYRRGAPGRVVLRGSGPEGAYEAAQSVQFGIRPIPNHLATKLWAAAWMERHPDAPRSEQIRMSLRFGLPGPHTSWLAVPREEMQLYWRLKLEPEIQKTAQQLATRIQEGRGRDRIARHLRRRLDSLAARTGTDPGGRLNSELREYASRKLEREIQTTVRKLVEQLQTGRAESSRFRRLRRELNVLLQRTGVSQENRWEVEIQRAMRERAAEWAEARHALRPNRRRIAVLRRQVERLAGTVGWEAVTYLENAVWDRRYRLDGELSDLARVWAEEKYSPQPDPRRLAVLKAEVTRFAARYALDSREALRWAVRSQLRPRIEAGRDQLDRAYREQPGDTPQIRRQEGSLLRLYREIQQEEAGKAQMARLRNRAELERLTRDLQVRPLTASEQATLLAQRDKLRERDKELARRMGTGDPLVRVEAPPDAQRVIALLPDGEVRPLTFQPETGFWEFRFDVPTWTPEGPFLITVVIVHADGSRRVLPIRYHVDLTPPEGRARAERGAGGSLRLELTTGEDTARVTALLPWGERMSLVRGELGRFTGTAPAPGGAPPGPIRFILTDRAHNRTLLEVEGPR